MPGDSTKIPVSEEVHDHIHDDLAESVEELRSKLEAMKKLLAENQSQNRRENGLFNHSNEPPTYSYYPPARYESLIDGNFLSVVFAVVFLLIVGVSFYAFQNLYFAVLKKFPSRHTEL
ncbi:uncharacterized protein LOC106668174 [Cimex lectularius]|uniref:Uncharacterized protein n=1 Tax=Cimex lectularius TaxID=79782 RepID=A0A8I6SUB8_CIMLE|nr:uncharacterized protein LOC106668174 [Cimex lectularius]